MGTFNVSIQAVGGHGCQREIKDGGTVQGCGHENCPDCAARRFVAELKRMGCSFTIEQGDHARVTHWPGQSGQVVDDLLSGQRSGSF